MDDANKDRAVPDLSGMIEQLLSKPELLSTVASALGKPMPFAAPSDESTPPEPATPLPEAISTLAPLLSGVGKGLPPIKKDDPRVCLLLALKPYLNARRCQTIDEMLRLSALGELLRGLGIPLKGGQ